MNIRLLFPIGIAISLLAVGCVSPVSTCHPVNIVAFDPEGSLRTPLPGADGTTRLAPVEHPDLARVKKLFSPSAKAEEKREAKRSDDESRRAKYLHDIFHENPQLDQRTKITNFIHGGMNGPDAAVERADLLVDPILGEPGLDAYPIFVCWNSSLLSAWGEQYYTHRGRNDLLVGAALAPLTFTANFGRFLFRLPLSVFEQGYAGLRTFRAPAFGTQTNSHRLLGRPELVNGQYNRLKADGYRMQLSPSSSPAGFRWRSVFMILGAGPKFLIEGAVDTGGKIGWDFMLRRTQTMFTLPDSFKPGGMELFSRALVDYASTRTNLQITIIGHSMGSIVANELIRRHGKALPISNIVYLAAACGVEDFDHDVMPYLFTHPTTHFYNLSLHPGNDISEQAGGWMAPISPRGSLLDWIDFYYSSKDTDYGWAMGKWDNAILGSKRFIYEQTPGQQAQLKSQIQMKAFGYGPKHDRGPQHHGGFDQWTFWKPAFWDLTPYDDGWQHSYLTNTPCARPPPQPRAVGQIH